MAKELFHPVHLGRLHLVDIILHFCLTHPIYQKFNLPPPLEEIVTTCLREFSQRSSR